MKIGILYESNVYENRVSITPYAVHVFKNKIIKYL